MHAGHGAVDCRLPLAYPGPWLLALALLFNGLLLKLLLAKLLLLGIQLLARLRIELLITEIGGRRRAPEQRREHTVEHGLGRAIHEQVIAGLFPVDLQRTAGQIEPGAAAGDAEAMANHQGGAGAGAAGQGGASAPLPYPHHQVAGAEGLDKMHVGLGRKAGVQLQGGAEALQIHLLHIGHWNHHVGIAHAGGAHLKAFAGGFNQAFGDARGADLQGGGNGGGLQEGGAHVHPNRAVAQQFGHDAAGEGVYLPLATGLVAVAVGQEASQATDAIATHLRLGAIGVEDAHAQFAAGIGGQSQDQAIATHAKAAVAEQLHQLWGELEAEIRAGGIAAVQHQEIVTQALILAERKHDPGLGS